MQSSDIQNYITVLNQILALPKTCENLTNLQNLITQLDTCRSIVLQSQSTTTSTTLTDKEQNEVHIIRSIPFNKISCFGFLVECYLDFDNKIAIEEDITIRDSLINQRMEARENIKIQIADDIFCSYFSSLIKFMLN